MPSDLDQLAQDADHQDRWGTPPTGNGLQDVATRGLPPPDPAPAAFTRAQEHQQRWGGTPDLGAGLSALASQAAYAPFGALKSFNDLIGEAMTSEDPYSRAYAGAELAKDVVTGGMGAAPKGALGMAGGRIIVPRYNSPEARAYYGQTIGMPEDQFASRLWGGLHDPTMSITHYNDLAGKRLVISGRITDKGQPMGVMTRTIYPEEGRAYHDDMNINTDIQGSGYSKRIIGSQFGLYPELGINQVRITALGEGASQWPKHGFLPYERAWPGVRDTISENYNEMRRLGVHFTEDEKYYIEQALRSKNREDIWLITDLNRKYRPFNDPHWQHGDPLTSHGRELTKGSFWSGDFSFLNKAQVDRANDYLKDYIGKRY